MKGKHKPAWTVLISQKMDRLRVPASTQGRVSPGKIFGNKVGLLLSKLSRKRVGELLNDPSISSSLIAINSSGTLGEFVNFYEIPAGQTVMQFLGDKIGSGDQKFMMDFSVALKPQSERTEPACDLYLLMLANRVQIEPLTSPKAILDFLTKLNPDCISADGVENFYKMLKAVGLPTGKG